jgi:cytochrome P450
MIALHDTVDLISSNAYVFWSALLPILLSLVWAVWYAIKFTITPLIWPDDPAPLPYKIPWLGSAIGFFKNSHAVISSGLSTNRNRDPFRVTLAGEGFYIVTNPKHVIEVYKNNTTFSFDVFVQDLMASCGTSNDTVRKMSQTPPPYLPGMENSGLNPYRKSLTSLAVDFHHTQLLPGPKSQAVPLTTAFLAHISYVLRWENLHRDKMIAGARSPTSILSTSLHRFCGRVLIDAGTKMYWGERLWQITHDMLETFYDLDNAMWKLLFRFPPIMSKDANTARDKIINSLVEYYRLPREERDDAAWFTKSMETESRAIGLTERDMASAILIIYFVVNGNTYKMCFWVLCHILSDKDLYQAIKAEIKASSADTEPRMEHLLNNCPLLDSVLSEVLRIYTSSASMRFIDEDTIIGGKIFRKGNRIMLPYRTMHENADIFGQDAHTFDARRFMKNPALKRSASYHPFGGGSTLCAGRFLARQEVLRFIGTTLWAYDIELLQLDGGLQQRFPRVDGQKPTFGMMSTLGGDDYQVSIRKDGGK